MNAGLIGAYAAAAVAIIGAVFAGLAQLQHNRTQHGQDGGASAGGNASPSARSDSGK